ncbi:MAG TPA: hypothetical protein VGI80_08965, partial [Pyrinomonadaceae bacterium]
MRRVLLYLGLYLPLLLSGLVATDHAQGGPPLITDDTETVPKGHYEINTGFTMEFTKDGHVWGTPSID